MNKIEYPSTVRTRIFISPELLRTERQWAKLGFLAIDDNCGQYLWTNQYCSHRLKYLHKSEVKSATKDEIMEFFASERKRRNERAKKRRKEKNKYLNIEKLKQKCQEKISSSKIAFRGFQNSATENVIVIDVETTGLDRDVDKLLQVSIIDENGKTLYNNYLKPQYHRDWEKAQAVNRISPEMVKAAPTAITECAKIYSIIKEADVIIGYNTLFDLGFLINIGCKFNNKKIIDVMTDFAEIHGEWSEKLQAYKFQKLSACAEYYGYTWECGNAHNSLADCLATLFCYKKIKFEKLAKK